MRVTALVPCAYRYSKYYNPCYLLYLFPVPFLRVRPVTRKKEQRTDTGYKEQIKDLILVSISM